MDLEKRLRNTTAVMMERIDDAMDKVLENIADVNTKPDGVREITLKLKIKPTNDRSAAMVEISCTPKLSAVAPYPATLYLGRNAGKNVVYEHNVNQADLFGEVDRETGELKENTIPMPGRKVMP